MKTIYFTTSISLALAHLTVKAGFVQSKLDSLVKVVRYKYDGNDYYVLMINRSGNHIKAKYFSPKGTYGNL
jgi:hypothetical protein